MPHIKIRKPSPPPKHNPSKTEQANPKRQEQERNTSTKAYLSQALLHAPPGSGAASWFLGCGRKQSLVRFLIHACHLTQGPCCPWVGSRVRRPSGSSPDAAICLYSAHPGDRRHSGSTLESLQLAHPEDRRQSRSTPEWLFCI